MFAQLGTIQFELLTGFSELSKKLESNIVEQALVNGKPRLQYTGEKLDVVGFKIKLHHLIVNPEDEIEKLNKARIDGEVLPFVLGNGFYLGDFVVASITVGYKQCTDIGDIIEAELDVALLEYYEVDKAGKAKDDARNKGFANPDNKPQAVPGTFGTLSESQKAALAVSEAKAEADRVSSAMTEAEKNPSTRSRRFKEASEKAGAVKVKLEQLQKIIFDSDGIRDRAVNLLGYIRAAIRTVERLKNVADEENTIDANQANQDMRNAIDLVQRGSGPVAGIVAIRKPI